MIGMNGWGEGAERNPPIPPIRLSKKVQETMQLERVTLWLEPTVNRRRPITAGGDQRPVISDREGKVGA